MPTLVSRRSTSSLSELVAALEGRPVTAGAGPRAVPRNPYKGLRAFQEADADDFFGRERLVERMLDRLAGDPPPCRCLVVLGPSGSGKSSVVRAGLVPRLRAGALPGSERWFVTVNGPRRPPLRSARAGAEPPRGATHRRRCSAPTERGLAHAVAQLPTPGHGDVVVLVVDQFEELFTLCADDEREAFIASLVEALADPRACLRVVATLRADFYDRPLRHPELATLVEAGVVAVTPLAPDELEAAIVQPAVRAGVSFEAALAATVAGDVRDQPGALPLLQYTMTELFERQESGVLTLAVYREMGGLSGAVARRAEALYGAADAEEQDVTRLAFLRLVSLGEGTEDTRRRVRHRGAR